MSLLPMNFLSNGVKGSGNMRRILGNFVYFVRKFKKQVSNLRYTVVCACGGMGKAHPGEFQFADRQRLDI
jgi:hypothetical protein